MIEGHNLGDPSSSTLVVGGYEVLPRLIQSWTPKRLVFTLSENMGSGLIYIKSGFLYSNSLFFINRSQVPEFSTRLETGAYLLSLDNQKLVPTTEVVLKGRLLGSQSEKRRLVFAKFNGESQ